MLKHEEFLKEFPVILKTDRDVENPLVIEFLQEIAPIESLLDIGAHTSCIPEKYGQEVRKLVKRYDGIDILSPTETESILDNYYVGNALEFPLDKYDVVICVSSIEHSGISTYKSENPYKERDKLFMKCLELAKKYLWISFPVGQEYTYPNELSIITEATLKDWEDLIKGYKVKERFFYNASGPQSGTPWREHSKREVAVKIPYLDFLGNQSICVMEIEK